MIVIYAYYIHQQYIEYVDLVQVNIEYGTFSFVHF